MIQKTNELGVQLIKTVAKEGCDDLKTIHYAINQEIYPYIYRYLDPISTRKLLNNLVKKGIELKELRVPTKAEQKKKEILEALRNNCKILTNYLKVCSITNEDGSKIQSTINFQIANWLKEKDTYDINKATQYLMQNRMIWDYMVKQYNGKDLKLDAFIKMQNQIIEQLTITYNIK